MLSHVYDVQSIIYDVYSFPARPKASYLMPNASLTMLLPSFGAMIFSYKELMIEGIPDQPKPVSDDKAWEEMVKNMLRAEMMRQGVSYAALAQRLAAIGVHDNELNLKNKVGRGRFTAVFLMQCFKALGVEWLHVPGSVEEASRAGGAHALAAGPRVPTA